MKPNWKLLLSILMGLVIIGCASPQPVPTRKIHFDLKGEPYVLVNELGRDIVVDPYNVCYALLHWKDDTLAWIAISPPLSQVHLGRTSIPRPTENTVIRSGSSVPVTGACEFDSGMPEHPLMNAWMYWRLDEPQRRFAVYSDNVDPTDADLHLPVTTSALASSPFQVKFQNTSSITINVPLNCLVYVYPGDLPRARLERQTDEGWEVYLMNLMSCSDRANEERANEKWLDIAPQMSGTVDLRSVYPAWFILEKGRYRWATIFCAEFPYTRACDTCRSCVDCPPIRECATSFSPTFDYPPEQAPQSP